MRKLIFSLLLLSSMSLQAQFTGYNMVQVSRWDNDSLPGLGNQQYNSCWGWTDTSNGREYAILGSIDSTYFFDITLAHKPVLCDVEPGRVRNAIWREYKTYGDYLYAACDQAGSSMQIFDMRYLPDSVHKVYDEDSVISRSHTLWVDGNRLYANSCVDGKNGTMHAVSVFSLVNPEVPEYIGSIVPPIFSGQPAFTKCHDAFVRGDTLYCSGEIPGVFIYDVSNMNKPVLMGTIQDYPERGYNHSGAVSGDGKTFVFTDENAGLGIKAYDITNFGDLTLKSVFRSHKDAVAHNPYFIGNRLFMSYYHDGVYVFDMDDPAKPRVIAWYDTYPQNGNGYGGFQGCWQAFPDYPSGTVIASDMTNGLFVLRMDATVSVDMPNQVKDFWLYPNPATERFQIEFDIQQDEELELSLVTMQGAEVKTELRSATSGRNSWDLNWSAGLQTGVYLLQLKGQNTHICKKLVVR
ncbi:MAG: choice-of-anchor B family protein [Bacteroidetes bacterium]|nr:MAG: choice-of-anchor B family protein [Bacteroidota bacterium]